MVKDHPLDDLLKKELDVIEAKKKANESDISNLETQLNKQKDLKEAGYANNFDVLQRELEDKRANQAQQLCHRFVTQKPTE